MRILTFLLSMTGVVSAALLPIPNAHPTVSYPWDSALAKTWQGIQERNIAPWSTGMVHRPKSESPGDAVSEGQGYGMMVALFANDQATFNSIWQASETYMWNGKSLDWRTNSAGNRMGYGAATDADQDMAAMLILADSLVKAGIWTSWNLPNGTTYAGRAQKMLDWIWSTMVESRYTSNGTEYHLRPGDGWGGYSTVNVGYYTPAFYRVYAAFDNNTNHKWLELAEQGYRTLEGNEGAALGLGPDWCDGSGAVLASGPGYNAFDNGQSMYKDAIRILWRVATDAIWFDTPAAKSFLQKSLEFIKGKGGASAANFYQLNGELVCESCVFIFNGTALQRPRREHSPLTIGMWASVAAAVGTSQDREEFSVEMQKFYTTGANYWGKATDANGEDTLHNEMYFDQFLAWFGMSTLSGTNSNILYDIANPPPASIQSSQRPLGFARVRQGLLEIQAPAQTQISLVNLQGQQVWQVLHSHAGVASYQVPKGVYWVQFKAQGIRNAIRVAIYD